MKLVEFLEKKKRSKRQLREIHRHLETWINTGEPPHPFVTYSYNLPTKLEDAIVLAREISNRLYNLDPDRR